MGSKVKIMVRYLLLVLFVVMAGCSTQRSCNDAVDGLYQDDVYFVGHGGRGTSTMVYYLPKRNLHLSCYYGGLTATVTVRAIDMKEKEVAHVDKPE